MNELKGLLFALLNLLLVDAIFLLILGLLAAALAGTKRAAYAVMRRNFVGYFSNPTGYVFLCIFVFLTSLAAFWPYEFFNQNLATLDQLNYWFPLIMLVFIPAITMSIWAEERRQGTDELLLTLPADDFDIVSGKYMAAAAIFTASLLFSQLSTFITLAILTKGGVDTGLIFSTYLGYWFMGLTMLAIGMVASFLTGNLTVGFILGALFNAPLAFASLADTVVPNERLARIAEGMGLARSFDDFGRGVVSLSSVAYFLLVAGVALYLCMILIGRRHWTGGKDGNAMAWHYIGRIAALAVFTVGAVMLFRAWDVVRYDATDGKVSSLAPETTELIQNLDPEHPIKIDAFISEEIPQQYAETRYQLVNLLKEFQSVANKGGRKIEVNLHEDIGLFSEEATLAEESFGIVPVERIMMDRGVLQQKRMILGAALRSGLQRVTIPIFEYGVPVEYELVRSIDTVARGKRKRIGIVETDSPLSMGLSSAAVSANRLAKHPLVSELEKQYDVVGVDMASPVNVGQYDALIAVQPSTMAPDRFDRLVEAIKAGVPTAVYEDPRPAVEEWGRLTGTGDPKMGAGGMFGGPTPKGDIQKLWDVLELEIPGGPGLQGLYAPAMVWQDYNPYPSLALASNLLWVFIDNETTETGQGAFNPEHPVTSGLRQVLMLYAGGVEAAENAQLRHTPLLSTGVISGTIPYSDAQRFLTSGDQSILLRAAGPPSGSVVTAMVIEGDAPETVESADEEAAEEEAAEEEAAGEASGAAGVKAIYVTDVDMMSATFLNLRADPNQLQDVRFQLQNVTFLLNTIDWLTGESAFLAIRKHEPTFQSLSLIDDVREQANKSVSDAQQENQQKLDEAVRELSEQNQSQTAKLEERIKELQQKIQQGEGDPAELRSREQELAIKRGALAKAMEVKQQQVQRDFDREMQRIRRQASLDVVKIQNSVKAMAVTLPCIPPLLVGIVVFASRRLRERENISKARLK